ncbi:MAG: aspartate dehydrogenase [Lachnospiraceae bacterium]|nr:aspartate dehydrogenase [Lachnospiraceae bacterium]
MFGKKAVIRHQEYDKENYKPVIKCSICTGEQVAGFKNIHTGKFEEAMLIRSSRDLEDFQRLYGVTDISKEY